MDRYIDMLLSIIHFEAKCKIWRSLNRSRSSKCDFFFKEFSKRVGWLDAGSQTDTVLWLSYSGNLRPNVKAYSHRIFEWPSVKGQGHERGQGHENENCGKLSETCGELKISFSKFPYTFDIFSWLSHFVVAEHWCRGAMFLRSSRLLLSQIWEEKTHAVVILYVGIKWCYSIKIKVANTFHFFPYC